MQNHLPEISRKTHAKAAEASGGSRGQIVSNHSISKPDFRTFCLNVNDFQRLAKISLPQNLYEYLASGTDDEQTLEENCLAFKRWYLRPRVMRPVGGISTKSTLFGYSVSMPVFCSPAGVHALCNPQGECATARAASDAGILFGLSQHSTKSIEEVAAATPPTALCFYQAYILRDRSKTIRLIRRAIEAGYKGIFVTVDSVRFGYREADARNGFNALPPPHRLVNYDDEPQKTSSHTQHYKDETVISSLANTYNSKKEKAWDQNSEQMFEQNVTWDDLAWMRRAAGIPKSVPLVVKGVMTGEDAIRAVEAGADGVMVSNHGGRQLDGALATIDALPEVVSAVGGRVPVWLDSGVRRGTDILKALALGASAVGIGKPMFFSLAVGGQEGVSCMLELLRTELEAAMAICGVERISEIPRDLVTRHPSIRGSVWKQYDLLPPYKSSL